MIIIPAGSLATGFDTLTATYTPNAASSSTFSGSSGSSSVTVSPTGTGSPGSDFLIQVSPATQEANPAQTATYLVTTATTSGTAQNVMLIVGDLPNGVTSAVFSPAYVASGTPSTLTLTLGSTIPVGMYTFQILGVGGAATHSTQVSLAVSAPPAGPALTLMPPSQIFPSEAVGTSSPTQTAAIRNSGGSPLTITGVSVAAGGDYGYILPSNQSFPLILNPNVVFSFQVYFLPSATGPRTGQIYIWDNAPGSPHIMSFTGDGLPSQPSTGTIQVLGTLNGSPLPSGYGFSYTLTGPSTYTGGGAYTFNATPGAYALSFSTCCGLTLSSVTPSPSQTVSAGGQVIFTMNFTASNDFFGPYFGLPQGNTSTQIVPAGGTATYYPVVEYSYYVGSVYHPNPATPITLQVIGLPPGTAASFNPQPSYGDSTLSVTTSMTTPPGIYTLSLTGANTSGLVRPGTNTAALVVTAAPNQTVQRVSISANGTQANAQSFGGALSADGRYVAFLSGATNLTSDTNNDGSVYIRDLNAGTTIFASFDTNGNPFLSAVGPLISASGRHVAFGANGPLGFAVYLRDLQLNKTERDDVASNGTVGNGNFSLPRGISADGRFVLFDSNATNLAQGANNGTQQCYLRDRTAGTTVLVSVDNNGNAANSACSSGAISADGRYIAFASAATNLVSLNLNGNTQIFVRDVQLGQTQLVSVASDGTAANAGSYTANGLAALSADGRFVVFSSLSTNLTPEAVDGSIHFFLRDRQLQSNSLVDADSNGALAGGPGAGAWPSISADGRFVSFVAYNEVFVRDMTTNQSLSLSLAADGTAGNGTSTSSSISPGGSIVSFASASSNLVSGDTNNVPDAFAASNPFIASPYVQTFTTSSASVAGGSSITGSITLNAPAPGGGASVAIWANNGVADVPAIAFVPVGATAATFTIGTSVVSTETVITVMAAYNGGSAIALLTVEPSPVILVNPPAWDFGSQAANTASSPQNFSIQNVGTAPLSLAARGNSQSRPKSR